jgi:hypothetical protein
MTVKGGDGSGLFDVSDDTVYSCPVKSTSIGAVGIEYTNLRTKKSFLAKANTPEEIIVTNDGIYRRGMIKMDNIFQYNMQIVMSLQKTITQTIPTIDPKEMANSMKNISGTMEQGMASFEMFKQMSPDDLVRLMKMNGAEVSPEVLKQMKELPEMIKMMEEKGLMKEMKKATAMSKGLMEGMGNENIERMAKMNAKGMAIFKEKSNELTKIDGKDVDELLERPRMYNPLTKEFGAVKVG